MKQKIKTKIPKPPKKVKITFEYIEVPKEEFVSIIKKAIEMGITKPSEGGIFGCSFFYGDARIFKKKPHIIAMMSFDEYAKEKEYKYNLTTEFKEYMEKEA